MKHQETRRAAASLVKPYTRPSSRPQYSSSISGEIARTKPNANVVKDNPGFPTHEQYKQAESIYLNSLSPRRQDKALINQATFDRIWDVLNQPDTPKESAQFRFWARRMFNLSQPGASASGGIVLLHNNLPVAIQEQLYDLLCYCHGSVGHGGRDKTCLAVRKHYCWVPKELVTQFIKACPTCILKKAGQPNMVSTQQDTSYMTFISQEPRVMESASMAGLRDLLVDLSAQDEADGLNENVPSITSWPATGGPTDPTNIASAPGSYIPGSFAPATGGPPLLFSSFPSGSGSVQSSSSVRSHQMSREVSLFQGLPNGWQYHSAYPEARNAFLTSVDQSRNDESIAGEVKHTPMFETPRENPSIEALRAGARTGIPRVPSIAGFIGFGDNFRNYLQMDLADAGVGFSSNVNLTVASGQQGAGDAQISTSTSESWGGVLQPLQNQPQNYIPQIDPALLADGPSPSSSAHKGKTVPNNTPASASSVHSKSSATTTPTPTRASQTSSTGAVTRLRMAPPPPLDLSTVSTNFQFTASHKKLLDFRADRDRDGQMSPLTPASVSPWVISGAGTGTSSGSSYSQDSPFGFPSTPSDGGPIGRDPIGQELAEGTMALQL